MTCEHARRRRTKIEMASKCVAEPSTQLETEKAAEELQLDPNVFEKIGVRCLKPAQLEGLKCLLSGHDVLAILPTGYGKSLIYHMFPHFCQGSNSVVLIVSPLVSLMKDQISTLSSLGFEAGMVRDVLQSDCLPTYVFGSPEDYLQSKDNIAETLQAKYGDKIVLLVVDEVHTIPKWGDKPNLSNRDRRKAQEGAFREYFSNVGELRSFFPDVKLLALTATASRQLQSQIKDSLIIQDCKVINICPNKENIRYSTLKIHDDVAYNLFWMVDKLEVEKDTFPRKIFYCPSIDMAARLFTLFRLECPGLTQSIGMYHSETDTAVQESHLHELTKESSSPLRMQYIHSWHWCRH
ncbi:ATP-dependent DNA helicase Q1-like [Ptychodera flava]|uniref:ATP-dependent DNA helicase Q1-like n=1 Tax=Ptychodera flava TaxID=63121 RepID=UPI00396A1482